MEKKESRSLLEKITDIATIISAFGIVVAIVQMCSQNKQFNDSFDLSNKQFQYQLKQDSLQDKADSIKDYRDSVKLQLAISEFEENKKNQETEAKRNKSQFEKNIQTLQELVRTNKQSNEYVINSQKPLLNLELKSISVVNDSIIVLVIHFNNVGIRKPFLKRMTHIFINDKLNSFHTITSNYTRTPIGNDNTDFTIDDHKYINLLTKEEKNKISVNFILDINCLDEVTNTIFEERFHYKISDLNLPLRNINESTLMEKQILDKFIESKRKIIFKN
jgi:hypothetical protein